jgi:hypothetical protein
MAPKKIKPKIDGKKEDEDRTVSKKRNSTLPIERKQNCSAHLRHNLNHIACMKPLDDLNEFVQLEEALRKKLSSGPSSLPSGSYYIYQIPFVTVSVVPKTSEKWLLVKPGRSDPNNIAKRLIAEGVMFRSSFGEKFTVSIPGCDNDLFKKEPFSSQRVAKRASDLDFIRHCRDCSVQYQDLAWVTPINICLEKALSASIGLNVGHAICDRKKSTRICDKGVNKNGSLRTRVFRIWLAGMDPGDPDKEAYKNNCGEKEFLIMPKSHFQKIRQAWLNDDPCPPKLDPINIEAITLVCKISKLKLSFSF